MNKTTFTADLAELRKKTNFVRNGLGSNRADLQTALVRCTLTGDKLTLFAANKDLLCRCEMKVDREEDDGDTSFAIMGAKLGALTTAAQAERVSFEADQENLKAAAGFLTVNLTTYDGAGLKQTEQTVTKEVSLECLATDRAALEEALTCGRTCSTTDSIRPDVNHVELRRGRMLASDGRKVMLYTTKAFDPNLNLKVPTGTLGSFTSALKGMEAEKVLVAEGASYYYIQAGLNEHLIGVRKTERSFPAIEDTVLKGHHEQEDEVAVDQRVLQGALQGVALGLDNDETKVTFTTEGEGTNATLEVSALNSRGRRSYERTTVGRTAKATLSFPVSYKHLLDTLAVFKGDSVVDLGVNTKLNLLTVRDTNADREVLTLIPFRTDHAIQQEKAEKAEREETKRAQAQTDTTEDGEKELEGALEEHAEELA